MSDTTAYDFETPTPIDFKIELNSGEIHLNASDTSQTRVELEAVHGDKQALELIANARVEQHGDKISVTMPKSKGSFFGSKGQVRATISLPHDSRLRLDTGSADVKGHGRFANTQINTGSGDVELEQISGGDIKAGSGDVVLETVLDTVKVKTGSGDVVLGPVGGSADVMAGSGDVVLDTVSGELKVKTGSGDVVINSGGSRVDAMAGSGDVLVKQIQRGEVVAKTGSGDVTIGVAEGTAAYLDIQTVTGSVTSSLDATSEPLDGDPTVSIKVISGSGDVVLQRP